MLKEFITLGVIGIMAMGIPSTVCGDSITNSNQTTINQQQTEYLHLKTDSAFDLIPMLGKDLRKFAIPEEAIKYIGSHPFTVYYDTNFMDTPVNASLAISYDYTTKIDTIKNIYVTIKEPQFNETKLYLDSQLGKCHSCDTLPFVASKGGAVTFFTYYKDGYKYHLSMGSINKYYTLEISKEEPKSAPHHGMTDFVLLNPENTMTPSPDFVITNPAPINSNFFWTCENCGFTTNKGKFCIECGTKRK